MYHNTAIVLHATQDRMFKPSHWNEYMHYMLSPDTEPDELVLLCAVLCFKTQMVVTVQNLGSRLFEPPEPQRRIHLLFATLWRHFSWAHRHGNHCSDPENCATSSNMSLALVIPPLPQIVLPQAPQRVRLGQLSDWQNDRRQHIFQAHNGFTGHPGITATVRILQENGHRWRGMTAQVTQFISQCPTCNLARIAMNPARTAYSSLRLLAAPLRRWHCDNTGILETCVHTGFTRIQVSICETSGYVVLCGSRFGSALEMVLGLINIVGTFGLFESFHTDNGPENEAYIIHQFQRLTGIRHTLAIPINPQTNGLAEATVKNVKRFLRCMISDGLTRHNGWGLMLPILQQAINATACGPLNVSPNSIVFASLHPSDAFVIPTTQLELSPEDADINVADGNHYPPSANFVTRAAYFQQLITNRRHELLLQAMHAAVASPDLQPDIIPEGSQVLIPWPGNRAPSSLHPFRRGPYIVTRVAGNVLSLSHAVSPLPDSQPLRLRWSSQAQIYSLDPILNRDHLDPAAVNSPSGIPVQRAIECVVDYYLIPSFNRANDTTGERFSVRNQVYTCRLFAASPSADMLPNWRQEFYYEDICHSLAFDSFIANHPFLTGHVPIASMPLGWDPRAVLEAQRPIHDPVIEPERPFPVLHQDDDDPIDD
jgi:hypothetical protein